MKLAKNITLFSRKNSNNFYIGKRSTKFPLKAEPSKNNSLPLSNQF